MACVVVTGAGGFVGCHLRAALEFADHSVRSVSRTDAVTDALAGADCIVHLAGRVHVLKERDPDPRTAYSRDNVELTLRFARAAVEAKVRRFVFASTARVYGAGGGTRPFVETDAPAPSEPYERSKLEAERALQALAARCGLEVVVLRIPLVYGRGVKANFLSLMEAVDRGIPLPLAGVRNRRSFVYVGNLVSALCACVTHPAAAGQVLNVSDGEDLSTPDLVRAIATALGRKARLFPVPVAVLRAAARLAGQANRVERLCGSLALDISAIGAVLGWKPSYSVAQGLAETARWYRAGRH